MNFSVFMKELYLSLTKEQKTLHNRKYYENNRDKILQDKKIARDKNPELYKSRSKVYFIHKV